VPERLVPIANLALAGLAAVAAARLLAAVPGRRVVAAGAALGLLVAADLVVQPLRASVADEGNAAYAALPPAERILELPLFEPAIHFGSVYQHYALQAPRERPGGYSTLAPAPAFEFFFALNRLNCGVWLAGDGARLRALGIGPILFHAGSYRQGHRPGAWFAWRALTARGYRPVARDGQVTMLRRRDGPPAEAPAPEPPHSSIVFCEGWRLWTTVERQAPFWLYGDRVLSLTLSAPGPTSARVWVDGRIVRRITVAGPTSVELRLRGRRWHWLMLEVPTLFATTPPQGLRLLRVSF
jgi:hypothetical protein